MIAPSARNGVQPTKALPQPTVVCPWYTTEDLCVLFGVVYRTIEKWTESGRIPRPVKRGRKWKRWPRTQIDSLIQRWAEEVGHAG